MIMMLTKIKPDGTWNVVGADGKEIPAREIPTALYGALCKLRDYEKLELDPGAIAKMKNENSWLVGENKRLTAENARLNELVGDIEGVLKGED